VIGRAALTCVLVAVPSVALACPSCLASSGEANRLAFLGTMVLLTSLPVLMIGSLIFWIARRSSVPVGDIDRDAGQGDAAEPREAPRLVE
jgi:hypothetical protein